MTDMWAVVKQGPSVQRRRVPMPKPRPGELLIRVAVAGVCRTDVHVAQGRMSCADPVILGHELAGVVADAGWDELGFAVGDRVAVMPAIPAGVWLIESTTEPQLVALLRRAGIDARTFTASPVIPVAKSSGFTTIPSPPFAVSSSHH